MNNVRAGLVAVVLGLVGMSSGMKELLAGSPCAPKRYGPLAPHLTCGGACAKGAKCAPSTAQMGRVSMTRCTCDGKRPDVTAKCEFVVYVTAEGRIVPACVEMKCGVCASPKFDVTTASWVCACRK